MFVAYIFILKITFVIYLNILLFSVWNFFL